MMLTHCHGNLLSEAHASTSLQGRQPGLLGEPLYLTASRMWSAGKVWEVEVPGFDSQSTVRHSTNTHCWHTPFWAKTDCVKDRKETLWQLHSAQCHTLGKEKLVHWGKSMTQYHKNNGLKTVRVSSRSREGTRKTREEGLEKISQSIDYGRIHIQHRQLRRV